MIKEILEQLAPLDAQIAALKGSGNEMDAITACVVGGVSMTGGVGKPWGCCHRLSAHHRYRKRSGHHGRIVPLAEDRQGRYHRGSCPDRRKGKDQEKLIFADKEAAGVLRAPLSSSSYSQRL